ncbi:cilia- and flagella-associated protein 300-like isoform X1 [Mytilus trossulus]|uniref:cilia- and flagella-associated protein 300-like isoform X1 n=2 Tax=Mytilus trossulus TaxID=6551 RepID=UPI00300531C6
MEVKTRKFSFQHLNSKKFSSIDSKESQESFLKWSMKGRICAQMYSFDQSFQAYEKDSFVMDFLTDPNVHQTLKVVSSGGGWSTLGVNATSVKAEIVPCTVLSMSFFDRIHNDGVVRESGAIQKCFDEFYEDMVVSDELRKMLLIDDSDHFCLYSDTEREELLFCIFKHICLGGKLCQFEDNVEPYLDITKNIYKDLISVQKNSETKELNIISHVFKISAKHEDTQIYPADTDHEQSFAYLVVDPFKRHISVFYHSYGNGVFE